MPQEPPSSESQSLRARRKERQRRSKKLAARLAGQSSGGVSSPETPTAGEPQSSIGKPKLREQDITGLKYFDQLAPLLKRLHDDACQRDTAGNRELHYDQYCLLI